MILDLSASFAAQIAANQYCEDEIFAIPLHILAAVLSVALMGSCEVILVLTSSEFFSVV